MIIDLGCGQRVKEDSTHIVDMVRTKADGKKYICHDLNKNPYPFKSDSADKIYADNVFEHLEIGLEAFLKECSRILKQDGTLVFKMPNFWFIVKRIRFLLGWSLPGYHPQHRQFFRPSHIYWAMVEYGFDPKGSCSNLFSKEISLVARKR